MIFQSLISILRFLVRIYLSRESSEQQSNFRKRHDPFALHDEKDEKCNIVNIFMLQFYQKNPN